MGMSISGAMGLSLNTPTGGTPIPSNALAQDDGVIITLDDGTVITVE